MVERLKEHAEGLDEEGLDEVTFRNLENAKTMAEQELDALEEVLETVGPIFAINVWRWNCTVSLALIRWSELWTQTGFEPSKHPQVKPVANSFIQLYNLAEPLLDKMAMVMTTIDMMKEGYGNLKSK